MRKADKIERLRRLERITFNGIIFLSGVAAGMAIVGSILIAFG